VNETIREVLKRRVRWCLGAGAAGFAVWLSVPMTAIAHRGEPNPILMFVGFALFAGGVVCLQWFAARCPRCSQRMGQEIAMRLGIALFRKAPNYCPYCGVSFDEPMSAAAQPAQSQNPLK
jgi:hypothetical protein